MRYEYYILSTSNIVGLNKQLNSYGEEGWRCVGYTENPGGGFSAVMEWCEEQNGRPAGEKKDKSIPVAGYQMPDGRTVITKYADPPQPEEKKE